MGRPGIMMYFELLDAIGMMSNEDAGQLLRAMLTYGRDGIEPELDGQVAIAWAFIRPKLDRDAQAYQDKSMTKRYAVYCRECKRQGVPPMERGAWDQWMANRMLEGQDEQTGAVTGLAHTMDVDVPINLHGLVALSQYQIDMLQAKMGNDTLQQYIDRLAEMIRCSGPINRDHCMVILQWWSEDRMQQ